MQSKTLTKYICVGALLLAVASSATAVEIVGKIEQAEGKAVTIRLTSESKPKVGDQFAVHVEIPGVGKAQVAAGKITSISGTVILGTVDTSSSRVKVGQSVTISSQKPIVGDRATSNHPAKHSNNSTSHDSDSRFPPWPNIKPNQAWLGATVAFVRHRKNWRERLSGVLKDGPSGKAGLQENDLILKIGDTKILETYKGARVGPTISKFKSGESVEIEIERDGKRYAVTMTLEPLPADGGNSKLYAAAESGEAWAMHEIGVRFYVASLETPDKWPYMPKSEANGLDWIKRASNAGSAPAAKYLGDNYRLGSGVEKSPASTEHYYERARSLAKYDAPDGVYKFTTTWLAQEFLEGRFLPKNTERAVKLYQDLAERGDASAATALGDLYIKGNGVPQNQSRGLEWHHRAAKAGNAQAQYSIGVAAYSGKGFQQDYATALAWFKLSAENGYFLGMHYLGIMYEEGTGVPKDFDTARYWYQKSIDSSLTSNPVAKKALLRLDRLQGR